MTLEEKIAHLQETVMTEARSEGNAIIDNHKKALKANDVIVLASDGFSDAFENKDDMAALLAETESSDPQIIADKLFGKAMINYDEKPKDDITVIVARIKQ